MPAFGPAKIRGMFSSMTDIASQLLAKWEVRYVLYSVGRLMLTYHFLGAEVMPSRNFTGCRVIQF